MAFSMAFLAVLCIGMGLLLVPGLREWILEPAVRVLTNGLGYAQNVFANL
jgi:hypothetical protein